MLLNTCQGGSLFVVVWTREESDLKSMETCYFLTVDRIIVPRRR